MTEEAHSYISPFDIDQLGKTGDLREALNFALHEIREGCRDIQLYFLASSMAYDLGDIQKSEQLVKLLLAADPEHINGWLLFGKINRRKGDQARSAYGMNRVEEIFPALAEFDLLNKLKEPKVVKNVDSASSSDATTFETRTFADICIQQGYYNKALKIYNELREKRPDDPEIGQKIDEIKRKMGKND
jgi:tetratricopeptide (TPR) repeat protein